MIVRGATPQAFRQLFRTQLDIEEIGDRPPPCEMSDAALLRYGTVLMYMCNQSCLENEQRESFALRLREVRKEWKRRFPRLPLSSTFDQDEDEFGAVSAHSKP
jgi:hypothetical protein